MLVFSWIQPWNLRSYIAFGFYITVITKSKIHWNKQFSSCSCLWTCYKNKYWKTLNGCIGWNFMKKSHFTYIIIVINSLYLLLMHKQIVFRRKLISKTFCLYIFFLWFTLSSFDRGFESLITLQVHVIKVSEPLSHELSVSWRNCQELNVLKITFFIGNFINLNVY